jgi:outer membrane protein
MKTDYDQMYEQTQKLRDAANDPTLSPEARADRNKAFEAKMQDLQNMQAKLQQTTQERNSELQDEIVRRHNEIVQEIAKVVTDYSAPQGFDLVIDKSSSSATGVPILLYSSSKLVDITDAVIAKLNADAPAGSLTVPAPTGAGTAPVTH